MGGSKMSSGGGSEGNAVQWIGGEDLELCSVSGRRGEEHGSGGGW